LKKSVQLQHKIHTIKGTNYLELFYYEKTDQIFICSNTDDETENKGSRHPGTSWMATYLDESAFNTKTLILEN
jgi:hypothetical protein